MNGFELTERGKIIVAAALVIILLVIPTAIIFGLSSCSGSSPNGESPAPAQPEQTSGIDQSPDISNTPLSPNGSGVDPSDPESPSPSADITVTPTPNPSPTPSDNGDTTSVIETPKYGPVGLNLSEGTMLFIYSPDEQEVLDDETVGMLGEFLKSPRNTRGSLVEVMMPHLSADDEAELISVVTQAFSLYNITENGLVYAMNDTTPAERYFEVALSFTAVSNQK